MGAFKFKRIKKPSGLTAKAESSVAPAPVPAGDLAESGDGGVSHMLLEIQEDDSECESGEEYKWQGVDEVLPYPGSSANPKSDSTLYSPSVSQFPQTRDIRDRPSLPHCLLLSRLLTPTM